MATFEDMKLNKAQFKALADMGLKTPTPIQSRAIPAVLSGKDMVGLAQTGTGKTAAFLVALYARLLSHEPRPSEQSAPRAFIMAPTRELAIQIHADAVTLGKFLPFRLGLVLNL